MEWIETAESHNIARFAYEAETQTLYVVFKLQPTSQYEYREVPEDVFDAMVESPSKGRFHNERVKGKYAFVKAPHRR